MSWVTEGSNGFTVNGNVVTHTSSLRGDNIYNCLWKDGDGESSGQHYWKIHLEKLEDGASVGLTSEKYFKEGYSCKGICYLGNLSNCGGLLVGNFGPRLKAGDTVGVLASFENDRLKVYYDINGKSLGLAFDVPATTFKSVYPLVCFFASGSAHCEKVESLPNIDRISTSFEGIEGDWKLKHMEENGISWELATKPTCKLRKDKDNVYFWHVRVCNNLNTKLSNQDGKWTTSRCSSTLMLGDPETMKLEDKVGNLLRDVTGIEINTNGELRVTSDTLSTTWTRYDSTPGPFVGNPFYD